MKKDKLYDIFINFENNFILSMGKKVDEIYEGYYIFLILK
jgi:hypothetical protein